MFFSFSLIGIDQIGNLLKCEEIEVDGKKLTLWLSEKQVGVTISDEGGWICGVFDGRESAIKGFELTFKPNGYELLAEINKRVNHNNNENRLITLNDLDIKEIK